MKGFFVYSKLAIFAPFHIFSFLFNEGGNFNRLPFFVLGNLFSSRKPRKHLLY